VSIAKPAASAPQPQLSEAERAWGLAKDTTSIPALEAFIHRFADTYYGDLAQVRLAELNKAEAAKRKKQLDAEKIAALLNKVPSSEVAETKNAGQTFRDCPDCPEMVVVPAGEFMMGSKEDDSERPPHRVSIQRPFAVGKFEVTIAEWEACVAAGGCSHRPEGGGHANGPVVNVSWHDAKEYAAWLSRKTGETYRLLTEAEWEYAARAGTRTRYAFGETITNAQAKYGGGGMLAVGSFPANKFGLHDMHGNVWEWCEDNWHPNYEGAPDDGSVWLGGDRSLRVLRGGSWTNDPAHLRSASRNRFRPDIRYSDIGFRLARSL
jgi:formylglycine-generating enzyme required for sulfatase activity